MPAFGGKTTKELQVLLTLKDKATAKLKGFEKNFGGMARKIATGATLAGGAMVAGIGTKAIKSAADFEKAMANVATLVDTNTENMEEMGRKVREISRRIPVDLGDLTSALYQVRSAGINASDAMSVLESSARLAVAGLGTTEEATNLLTSAFNVFSKQGYDANEISNILFKTVKAGKTTVADLARSFGMVAPIAGELDIDLRELQAATAALTTTGMTASIAQTQLRAGMVALLRPSGEMNDIFEKIGVKSGRELLQTSGGLIEAFKKIKEGAKGDDAALAKAFGSVEALNAVLALTGEEIGPMFIETLKTMQSETDLLTEGIEKQTNTTAAQYQLLKNKLNVVMIELGARILPYVIKGIEYLKRAIDWLLPTLAKWWQWWNKYVIDPLAWFLIQVDRATRAWENFVDKLKSIPGGISGMVKGAKEKAIGAIERIGERLSFQEGGIVPGPIGKPVPAVVHGGEMIIPPNKRLGSIVVNINGGVYLSEEVAEEIGNMIIKKLKLNYRI